MVTLTAKKTNPRREASSQNHLLALLPGKDRVRLTSLCDTVELALREVLAESGDTTSFVYFPLDSFISLIAKADGKLGLEVGMVGREGMLGAQLTVGVNMAPLHAVVQGAGRALRMRASAYKKEIDTSPAVRRIMGRHFYVQDAQLTASAACVRFHLVGPRLARWLLMSQDRARADTFRVTHEFLAYMLGVRRVGITTAAVAMQRKGLVSYRRGELTVLDRKGLEQAACSCYGSNQKLYEQLLPGMDR
jgi:CRP-like cAMP-binding protein